MTRKGDTVLVAALKRYGKKMKKYIQDCLHKDMKVKLLIEDARDSQGKASGAAYLEIEIEKKGGWGGENQIEIHGTVGFDKSGKRGKKEDEAYLDGVTVGDWDEGSKAIGLTGCSIGEFLVHIFTLFAIKAGNESVLLDNAAGPRGEHIYRQVGFIKSKGDRSQYGDDNGMIFPLTGKKKNKDAGQLWRERYNKFRKKLKTKIKSKGNCKSFWKCIPPALEAPGPVHMLARGSKRRTRKKRGGDAERPPITLNKQQFINMVENNPDKVYKIIRNLRTEGMDDPDDPDYGFNVWYNGKIEYEGFDEDWGGDVFGFTMYDEDGDEIRWSDIYPALKTGPDTDALDYEWINIKDAGQPIKFVGGKRRKKKTRKKRGGEKNGEEFPPPTLPHSFKKAHENKIIQGVKGLLAHTGLRQKSVDDFYGRRQPGSARWFWDKRPQPYIPRLEEEYGDEEEKEIKKKIIQLANEADAKRLEIRSPSTGSETVHNWKKAEEREKNLKARKTRRKRGGNGKNNKTKKKKETKCAGIKNAFGVCMTAANKTAAFNQRVIRAQDTSLGQLKTQYPSMLMGYPSDRGGGRKRKGGLLGPRELEAGRQYLYTGPEPHMMPQAEWQTPVRITVTYRGRNVPGLTPNQHYFDGEREIARDGHSLDIFSLDNDEIEQHIQPWVQNPGPSRVTNPSGVYAPRPRESTCENCTIMGGRKKRGGYGPGVTEEQARREREKNEKRKKE